MSITIEEFETWRWKGLAKTIWGLANEKNVKITWFWRSYPFFMREAFLILFEGTDKAIKGFCDSVNAAIGG